MDAARHEIWLEAPAQPQLNWLRRSGVDVWTMIRPSIVMMTSGTRHQDGRFDYHLGAPQWLVFEEVDDAVFWSPKTGEMATYSDRTFALGQDIIDWPETYSFDCCLNVFENPLDWLRAKRDGIVVLDWSRAFDRLRDVPRVAVSEDLLATYRRHMAPRHLPEIFIIPKPWRIAA